MTIKQILAWLVLITAFVLQGCSGIERSHQQVEPLRHEKTARLFHELDRLTRLHGVKDASRFSIQGYPYLRTDRFLEALKDRIVGAEQELYWIEWLQQSDLQSRRKEIANLPESAIATLADYTGCAVHPDAVYRQVVFYSHRLLVEDRRDPRFVEKVKRRIFVPDEYSTFRRWVGFYPLAGIPVTIATALSYSRYRKWHESNPEELAVLGDLMSYVPQKTDNGGEKIDMNSLFDSHNLDVFGLPDLNRNQMQLLIERFAPVITQDLNGSYDRLGTVGWREDRIFIDSSKPAVYFYTSHSFLSGQPVLQLNYALWYAERAGESTPWFEKGPLDGLTYRVTLDQKGEPIMLDVMNNCGCYYFFVPKKKRIRKIVKKPGELEPLIPAWMPEGFPKKRVHLQVNSGWHQVQRITTDDIFPAHTEYELIPYDTLESLPKENGRYESAFTSEGIMKDSWRIEPYLFFSMGVSDVGYMRQRGHHAVKLVGREHFTNPYVFDKNFLFIGN